MNEELVQIALLSPDEYRKRLVALQAAEELTWAEIEAVDDALCARCADDPELAEAIARLHLELLDGDEFALCRVYAHNTLFCALWLQDKVREAFDVARRGLALTDRKRFRPAGQSIIGNLLTWKDSGRLPRDEVARVVRLCVTHFDRIEEHAEAVRYRLIAAHHFADVQDFQAAWRVLADAESAIKEHSLEHSRPPLLETVATIAMQERKPDLPLALRAFAEARREHVKRGTEPSAIFLTNEATAHLWAGEFLEARGRFHALLARADLRPDHRLGLRTNLALATRELGEEEAARALLEEDPPDGCSPAALAEFHLVAAKTLTRVGRGSDVLSRVRRAVEQLELQLRDISRVHRRREFRRRELARIRELLAFIPPRGRAADVLRIVAFLRAGTMSDWLSLQAWCDSVQRDDAVPLELRDRLANTVDAVIRIGAPISYGMREKYDDPFEIEEIDGREIFSLSRPWHDFNAAVAEVLGVRPGEGPFDGGAAHVIQHLLETLARDGALFFPFAGDDRWLAVTVTGEEYQLDSIAAAPLDSAVKSVWDYIGDKLPDGQFNEALEAALPAMRTLATRVIAEAESATVRSLHLVTDAWTSLLPWPALFAENPAFRGRARSGDLVISFAPVLVRGQSHGLPPSPGAVALFDTAQGPDLASAELDMVEATLGVPLFRVDVSTTAADNRPDATILHVASHGSAISRFTDPYFARLHGSPGGNHLGLIEEQERAARSSLELAFLNVCSGASMSLSNLAKSGLIFETIGFSTVFLLNRRAATITTHWPITDIYAFLWARIFYGQLRKTGSPRVAYPQTLAEAFELTRVGALALASEVREPNARRRLEAALRTGREHPLRSTALMGAYRLTALPQSTFTKAPVQRSER